LRQDGPRGARHERLFAALLGVAFAVWPISGQAAGFVDGASGFKVDPPAPFTVRPAKSATYDLAVVINSLTGHPSLGAGDTYLCQIGYKHQADDVALTQDEINQQVEEPDWLDNAAAALGHSFTVTSKSTFVLDGATGVELVGMPKDATHASGVFVSMIDTPAGRTTLNCATRPEEVDSAAAAFRLLRSAIKLPGTTVP
jgi:hypothetical protein